MSGPSTRPLLVGMGAFTDQAGGLNRYYEDLVRALHRGGVQARGAVVGGCGSTPSGVVGVSRRTAPMGRRLRALRRTLRDTAADATLVDSHFALHGLVALTIPRLRRLPLVVHFQGPWAAEGRLVGDRRVVTRLKRRVELAVYRRADAIIVLSDAFRDLVIADYGIDGSRVHVVPPGVDLERFAPGDRESAEEPIVLCVRRLVARMGIDVLIRAWADAVASGISGRLVIAGEGAERAALRALADELGIADRVDLVGAVPDDDLPALYRRAVVTVVPTIALEGYGLVVLESLACGVPVVVSDVGALPGAIAALDPSLVVRAGDPLDLARRLVEALGGRVPTPSACRAFAAQHGWDAVAARHVAIYEQVTVHARPFVVYLDHTAVPSGGELALLRLLEASTAIDPHVVLGADGPLVDRLRAAGIAVEVLPLAERVGTMRRARLVSFDALRASGAAAAHVLRLTRRLRELRPDLVHTNSLKAAVYGGFAARLAGVPVVWHVRDHLEPPAVPQLVAAAMRALSRWVPSAVIANSTSTLASIGRAPRRQPRVVIASPVVASSSTVDHATGAAVHVIMVGRLAPWKGQDVFLRAMAQLDRDEVRATIVGGALFGEDDFEGDLRDLLDGLGLGDVVQMTGHRDDVAEILQTADVLVHASTLPEAFGQVVVEGMAAGLAVIATDAGGPAEVITNDVDGLLVPPGDVDALAQALRRLVDDPSLRARLSESGRRRAFDYRPGPVAAAVRDLYDRVLAR